MNPITDISKAIPGWQFVYIPRNHKVGIAPDNGPLHGEEPLPVITLDDPRDVWYSFDYYHVTQPWLDQSPNSLTLIKHQATNIYKDLPQKYQSHDCPNCSGLGINKFNQICAYCFGLGLIYPLGRQREIGSAFRKESSLEFFPLINQFKQLHTSPKGLLAYIDMVNRFQPGHLSLGQWFLQKISNNLPEVVKGVLPKATIFKLPENNPFKGADTNLLFLEYDHQFFSLKTGKSSKKKTPNSLLPTTTISPLLAVGLKHFSSLNTSVSWLSNIQLADILPHTLRVSPTKRSTLGCFFIPKSPSLKTPSNHPSNHPSASHI